MIIVPGKFIYVGSPRSGSYYIHRVLEAAFPDAKRSKEHHAFIADVLMAQRMHGNLPIYTIVRNPVEQLFSFYWASLHKYPGRVVTDSFETFIKGRQPDNVPFNKGVDFPPGGLTSYREIATMFFPFEKDFATFFDHVDVDLDGMDIKPLRLPKKEYYEARELISEDDKQLVYRLFPEDTDLWASINDSGRG